MLKVAFLLHENYTPPSHLRITASRSHFSGRDATVPISTLGWYCVFQVRIFMHSVGMIIFHIWILLKELDEL